MERIVKLIFVVFILCFSVCAVQADNTTVKPPVAASLSDCVKTFPIGYEKLYYLTLAATNEFDYQITEIQTRGGYIAFTTKNNQKFLASIIYVSASKAMLKITPYNGVYNFPSDIPQNFFKYIETYQAKNF